jgi:hypothetical protein
MASSIAALALLVLSAPALAEGVGVVLPGACARPLPAGKTASPCAAAHALNLLDEVDFLIESQAFERSLRPHASTAALACLEANANEFMYERVDLVDDLKRIRLWAAAAKEPAAEVEDASCVEAGAYMLGGVKSDHPKKMAGNVAASAWALVHHQAQALKRKADPALAEREKAATTTEAGEFSKQREFLLDQLGGLQAWTDEASSPARFVVVKDSAPFPVDAATIEKTLKEAEETLKAVPDRKLETPPEAARAAASQSPSSPSKTR